MKYIQTHPVDVIAQLIDYFFHKIRPKDEFYIRCDTDTENNIVTIKYNSNEDGIEDGIVNEILTYYPFLSLNKTSFENAKLYKKFYIHSDITEGNKLRNVNLVYYFADGSKEYVKYIMSKIDFIVQFNINRSTRVMRKESYLNGNDFTPFSLGFSVNKEYSEKDIIHILNRTFHKIPEIVRPSKIILFERYFKAILQKETGISLPLNNPKCVLQESDMSNSDKKIIQKNIPPILNALKAIRNGRDKVKI